MTPGQLGRAVDQEALLFPGRQSHRRIVVTNCRSRLTRNR
jgi:hypothetical protein